MDIKEGVEYILDKEFRTGGVIKVVKVYGNHFCRVKDPITNNEWDVMCNRLSEIEKGDTDNIK